MGYVRVGRAKSVQDTNRELIKVNKDIYKRKRVNVVFDMLHIVGNRPITLLKVGKILAIDHDPSMRRIDVRFFESGQSNPICGGGRDKLH